jgi:hypothetical protein
MAALARLRFSTNKTTSPPALSNRAKFMTSDISIYFSLQYAPPVKTLGFASNVLDLHTHNKNTDLASFYLSPFRLWILDSGIPYPLSIPDHFSLLHCKGGRPTHSIEPLFLRRSSVCLGPNPAIILTPPLLLPHSTHSLYPHASS